MALRLHWGRAEVRMNRALIVAIAASGIVAVSAPRPAAAQELAVALSEHGPGARVGVDLGAGFLLGGGIALSAVHGSNSPVQATDYLLTLEIVHRFAGAHDLGFVPTLMAGASFGSFHA